MDPINLMAVWADLLVASAADAGVTEVVICPGSRSSPLVVSATREPRVTCHDVIDERAAAFFALGQARVTGRPSMVICTSGSAAAHFLPAVVEASTANIPLLLVTADRPFELQSCGAAQTIDQVDIYGRHARHYADLGLPDPCDAALRGLRRTMLQAVFTSRYPVPGAVQINARARKPLEPYDAVTDDERALDERAGRVRSRLTVARPPAVIPNSDSIRQLAAVAMANERGVIACGPAAPEAARLRPLLNDLSRHLGYPLLAEATSQLRLTGDEPQSGFVCDTFEPLFRSKTFRALATPEVAIQLGGTPTATGWELLLDGAPSMQRAIISLHGWLDPMGTASLMIHGEPDETLRALLSEVRSLGPARGDTAWTKLYAKGHSLAVEITEHESRPNERGDITEAFAVRTVVESLPKGSTLLIGNSMAIRELDVFCRTGCADAVVQCQRGANGIDGLVAGAAGMSMASKRPVTLLIGDVTFLHDISSLALAAKAREPLVVVVLHNGGGRIFEMLPLARVVDTKTLDHVVMSHSTEFEHAARLFGTAFEHPDSPATLKAALERAHSRPGCTLIEVRVPPHDVTETSRRVFASLDEAVHRTLAPAH